jgi:aryl-alcohol dehydrogenase-like predicted oxidoreductase
LNRTKIGLGLAALGRPAYINLRSHDDPDKSIKAYEANAFKVMDFAYEKGIRHFDTAASYGKGEQFLLEWDKKNRHHDVVLSSKWGYSYVANWELDFKGQHEIKEHSLEKLIEQWGTAQKMLPALQLYQIHSATFESGVLEKTEVLLALDQIRESTGVKLGISVSGANQKDILQAASKITINNKKLFDSYQVTYNVLEQSSFGILKKMLADGKTVIIKEALANGRLLENPKFKHYAATYVFLKELSKKYGVGIDAVALRFIMDHLGPQLVLSGASNTVQLAQNIKALHFELSQKEVSQLEFLAIKPEQYWKERSLLFWQ